MADTPWQDGPQATPAAPSDFDRFEQTYGLPVPRALRQLYASQNGGSLRDVDWPDHLMPLATGDHEPASMRIATLLQWAQEHSMLRADQLDWIEEAAGEPERIFPLTSDGHTAYALNYNATPQDSVEGTPETLDEPTVVWLDFECVQCQQVASSFEAWIAQLLGTRVSDPAVNWDERHEYTVLFSNRVATFNHVGEAAEAEQVVCSDGHEGLLVFVRRNLADGLRELERVHLPAGVVDGMLEVLPPREDFSVLHLHAPDQEISWTTAREAESGLWKNETSEGVPIYCTVESTDADELAELASELRTRGLARAVAAPGPGELEPDPEFQADLQQLQNVGELLRAERQRAEAEAAAPLPDSPPPEQGPADQLTDDQLVEEIKGIILWLAAQLPGVHSLADAQRMMADAGDQQRRYIELTRELNQRGGPSALTRLHPAEMRYQELLNELLQRDWEAQVALDRWGKEILTEVFRPANADPRLEPILNGLVEATGELAELLEQVNADAAIAPQQRDALTRALGTYDASLTAFYEISSDLDAMAVGWAHQKRMQSGAHASLTQQLETLQTRHRKLYRANRKLLKPLEDYPL